MVTPGGSEPCVISYVKLCPALVSVSVACICSETLEPSMTQNRPTLVESSSFSCPDAVVNTGVSAPCTSSENDLSVIVVPAVARTTKV